MLMPTNDRSLHKHFTTTTTHYIVFNVDNLLSTVFCFFRGTLHTHTYTHIHIQQHFQYCWMKANFTLLHFPQCSSSFNQFSLPILCKALHRKLQAYTHNMHTHLRLQIIPKQIHCLIWRYLVLWLVWQFAQKPDIVRPSQMCFRCVGVHSRSLSL